MKIFIYEFVTGGGMFELGDDCPPDGSLFAEGAAMIAALAADFSRIEDVETMALKDNRLTDFHLPGTHPAKVDSRRQEQDRFDEFAAEADRTIVIAPEFDGLLLSRCQQVLHAGGKLLGPDPLLVKLGSDKNQTAEHLHAQGIRVPRAMTISAGKRLPTDFPYPAVLKPCDGAGSMDIQLISTPHAQPVSQEMRLEQFHPGTPVSVAFLRGQKQTIALPPCEQLLSDDGHFSYLGGKLPLPENLSRRALALAESVLATLPPGVGYLGIDLVLGTADDGSEDVVIELNPRLTTSYVALRTVCDANLAEVMLDLARGKTVEVDFLPGKIRFQANGKIDSASI